MVMYLRYLLKWQKTDHNSFTLEDMYFDSHAYRYELSLSSNPHWPFHHNALPIEQLSVVSTFEAPIALLLPPTILDLLSMTVTYFGLKFAQTPWNNGILSKTTYPVVLAQWPHRHARFQFFPAPACCILLAHDPEYFFHCEVTPPPGSSSALITKYQDYSIWSN
jgi:hypothetical protein